MKKMNLMLVAAAVAAMSTGSFANGGDPGSNGFGTGGAAGVGGTGGSGVGVGTGQGQNQGQGQTMGQGQTVNVNGGNSNGNGFSGLYLPPIIPAPPSQSPTTFISVTRTACGPLMQVVRYPVIGTYVGLFGTSHVDLGYYDTLMPVTVSQDPVKTKVMQDGGTWSVPSAYRYYDYIRMPNGGMRVMGSQAIISSVPINVSGARSLSLGGGSGVAGGEAGISGSSSMQRLTQHITIVSCEAAAAK